MRHPVGHASGERSVHAHGRWALSLLGSVAIVGALLLPVGAGASSADVVVNTTSDVADFGGSQQVGDLPGPDGRVSLREAITAANNTAGPQVIGFAIPASDPGCAGGVCTIRPVVFGLPDLTDDETTIDGSTQTSFAGNPNPAGPEIELNGSLTTCCSGLLLASNRNRVHHLVINGFGVADGGGGVNIYGSQNVVTGSYIGLDPTGVVAVPNRFGGVGIDVGTANRIGGRTPLERNVISGNDPLGVSIASKGNVVEGNFIGTDRTGSVDVGNGSEGVLLQLLGPSNNVIHKNVVSGNGNTGVFIRGTGNIVSANLIGTDASGTSPIGNDAGGVLLRAGDGASDADGNRIIGNVVSANGQAGVWFPTEPGVGVTSDNNLVLGNLIGTDVNGKVAPGMGNFPSGVDYNNDGGTGNVVGGNIIGGNGATGGVQVSGDGLSVVGNAIFENVGYGVVINTASGIIVRRNSVRANGVDGIYLAPTASSNSLIQNLLRANVEHDCRDDSTGSGTAGTANTWRRNNGQTSQPPGLCVPRG